MELSVEKTRNYDTIVEMSRIEQGPSWDNSQERDTSAKVSRPSYTEVESFTLFIYGQGSQQEKQELSTLKDIAVDMLLIKPERYFFSGTNELQSSFNDLRKQAKQNMDHGTVEGRWRVLRNQVLHKTLEVDINSHFLNPDLENKVKDIQNRYTNLQRKHKGSV